MTTTAPEDRILLFLGTAADVPHLARLKGTTGSCKCFVLTDPISTVAEVIHYCKKRFVTGVVSTNAVLLQKLSGDDNASIANYAGSMFVRDGIEFVFIDPLGQFITVSYGRFLTQHYISKLTSPSKWMPDIAFNWELVTPTNVEKIFTDYQNAFAIAVDIETFENPLSIRCIGYAAVFFSGTEIKIHACVLPVDSPWALAWMRKFNWELQAPKIFQNGKYDLAYLAMYNAPVYNYMWDTIVMMHCWYSELPKDLAFIQSFCVRKSRYWKDMADTNDLMEYYEYNARDNHAAATSFLYWMLNAPSWARYNYLQEFPLNFPCHMAEMIGVKRDFEHLKEARDVVVGRINEKQKKLEVLTATPNINPNSPKQVGQLLHILGCSDIKSTEEKDLKKAALRHPINSRIINTILDIRGDRKLISTYLRADEDAKKKDKSDGAKEYHGRVLYALNPHGTDTSRLASREHHFWCGVQIQNIPRGEPGELSWTKYTIVADEGFRFAECDLEQAESRDTAHIAGDESLIAAVTGTKDFHSINASSFFGVSYESIYDDVIGKTKNKKLRDLAKRVNHGANYLMGAGVLLDTMGEDKVLEAKGFLNLPKSWTLKQVCEYLLEKFHKTYPFLSSTFYPAVVAEVMTTRMLQHHSYHHTQFQNQAIHDGCYVLEGIKEYQLKGWTRYCFGNPKENKRDKNSYVAHVPQSLNAQTLNKAYMRVFYDIAIHPTHSKNFKLCAQIHDSILFQFREGHEYLCDMVKQRMEVPVTVKGYDGKTRTFIVPAAIKAGKEGKGAKYWSDTE